jgi:hypothetical protein
MANSLFTFLSEYSRGDQNEAYTVNKALMMPQCSVLTCKNSDLKVEKENVT